MKIPIKHAVDSGAWFKYEFDAREHADFEVFSDNSFNFTIFKSRVPEYFTFKFKIVSFEKIPNHIVREWKKDKKFDEGIFWLMEIETVNLGKEPLDMFGFTFGTTMILSDQDDCAFNSISVEHEWTETEYGKKVGINRFSGWSSAPSLSPKIKAVGAIPYLLPDDDNSEYHLFIGYGSIQEI